MSWNYRVAMRKDGFDDFIIIEVYYKEGEMYGWSENCYPHGYSISELKKVLEHMKEAFKKKVLLIKDDDSLIELDYIPKGER